MKKIAVILSGCGVYDGSEISESVLTLLSILQLGAQYQCLAPNCAQYHVINHLTQQPIDGARRNVLQESARIARGDILDLAKADHQDYDAAIFPGGFGAAKNLSDFAFKGAECHIEETVAKFIQSMYEAKKPQGFICIAPALVPKLFPNGVTLTIGSDQAAKEKLEQMGAKHQDAKVNEVVIDKKHKVVTTPAYMLAKNLLEAQEGILRLTKEVLALC